MVEKLIAATDAVAAEILPTENLRLAMQDQPSTRRRYDDRHIKT
jgi:hypothetical protein